MKISRIIAGFNKVSDKGHREMHMTYFISSVIFLVNRDIYDIFDNVRQPEASQTFVYDMVAKVWDLISY